MGSVSSSLNPGVADLLQTLTNVNSPIVNSKSAVTALESAPSSDIVQLSEEATQLQNIDTLFGIPTATSTSSMSGVLEALENPATASTTGTSASSVLANASPADQAANADAAVQEQLTQGLFGTGSNNSLGTLFNTLG